MAELLKDKTALITGGASGIGRAAALVFAREGARVVVADIDAPGGEATADRVRQAGGEARFIRCDVAQAGEVAALVQQAVAAYGRLDCAFNNAGCEGRFAPMAEATEENWDRVVAVNLKGVWLCMKYELQQMLAQTRPPHQGGAIVNTASVAGLVAERGLSAYAASKGGVLQLTRTAAIEYAAAHLRINAVCPGAIRTPMITRSLADMRVSAMAYGAVRSPWARRLVDATLGLPPFKAAMLSFMHPLGRMGEPEEIAEAAAWLCSDAASFITG